MRTTHILQTVNIAYETVACGAGTGIDHNHICSKGKITCRVETRFSCNKPMTTAP